MKVGYARVSTDEQILDLQLDALQKEGCDRIFQDRVSGAKSDRPQLRECLDYVREGDIVVVWRLDRLGRSLKHLIEIVEGLSNKGVEFKSITESMDTASPGGKLIFHIFGAIAEFERNLIKERTLAGLAAARARGRNGGRPRSLSQSEIEVGIKLAKDSDWTVEQICQHLNINRSTYYRHVHPRLKPQ